MNHKPSVHIIGGGFSGLMTAYFCAKRNIPVKISEGHSWGGLISTQKNQYGLIETAANSFLLTQQLQLVAQDIGVELLFPQKQARRRWIYNESPQRWPVPWPQTLAGLSHFLFLRLGAGHLPKQDELLSDWGNRVLGKTFQDRLLLPAFQGIYGLDSRSLSASLVLNPLLKKERPSHKGSVAPPEGMQQWIEGLMNWLRKNGVELREEKLSTLPDSERIILAGSSSSKAQILKNEFPEIAGRLGQIKNCPLISVTLFKEKSKYDLAGFGTLFHPDKCGPASGVLFNDQIFQNRSTVRSETWFFPGDKNSALSDDEIRAGLLKQRLLLMPDSPSEILFLQIKRWSQALPIYSVELEQTLRQGFQLPKNIQLVGNELGGIGLSSLAWQAERTADVFA